MKINGILLLYHHHIKANASTIMENVNAFSRHSSYYVWYVNSELGLPPSLQKIKFSIIILHYSLFGLPILIDKKLMRFLRNAHSSYKIAFLQDEHRYWSERTTFLNQIKVDCVYSLLEPCWFDSTYRKYTKVSKVFYHIPGYVGREIKEMGKKYYIPFDKRSVDVGYRGRRLPYYMGRGSQEKHWIGLGFKKRSAGKRLVLDIETDETARIYGDDWPKFIGNCKAVLGVEAGVSIFDIDDKVRPQYARLCNGNPDFSFPDCSFEDVYESILKPHEGRIFYRTISPRHFEAASLRVCQILFEGKYSNIMKPMVHYIPLKKDFSNYEEVISILRNEKLCKKITENAYEDLIASGKYSYRKFLREFDEKLFMEGLPPDASEKDVLDLNKRLHGDRFRKLIRTQLSKLRYIQFPGKKYVKLGLEVLSRKVFLLNNIPIWK